MIGTIIGVVSALIVAYLSYRLGERSARRKEERAQNEEDLEYKLYADIVRWTQDGSVFNPSVESTDFKRALKLQQRGLIERLPIRGANYFTVPGAPIRLDTSKKADRSATSGLGHYRALSPVSRALDFILLLLTQH